MTLSQSSKSDRTPVIRRLIAGLILSAAPFMVALDTATAAHADTTVSNPAPSPHTPAQHPAFPNRSAQPTPGTPAHHHHQHHRAG